jgi:DnaK suppressor protein
MTKAKVKQKKKSISDSFSFPAKVLEPVKNFLQLELAKLNKRKKAVEKEDPFADAGRVSDNAIDTDAAEQFGHARSEAIKRHINTRIIQIKKALARVKIGKYGICEKCGGFIDTKRLMVFPETTVCVKCEKKKEK